MGYGLARRAADIAEVLAASQVRAPHLVGWSLGALELMEFLRQGGKVSTAVFLDNSLDAAYAAGPAYGLDLMRSLRDRDTAEVLREFVSRLFKEALDPDWARELEQEILQMPRYAALEALKGSGRGAGLSELLKDPSLRALVLGTSRFQAEFEGLKKDFPRLQSQIFEDAGHALFVDQWDRFNRLLEAFLRVG